MVADRRVTDDTAILGSAVASSDLFDLIDVSDSTDDPTGTAKKILASELCLAIISLGSIATDAEVTAAISALSSTYQPLDSDLTAIAALATTSFGRGLLILADATAFAATIPSGVLTNAQLVTEAQSTIKGRAAAAGTGAVTDLTATQVRTIIDSNTTPSTQAFGDSATVGTADTLARGDHKHAWPSFATPSIALGSSAAAGSATTPIKSDATIAAFDATSPTTQAVGDSAAVGSVAFAARRDHKHAWPSASSFLSSLTGVQSLAAGGINSNVNTVAATGSTETLDTSLYAVHDCTMDQSCTFTFSNPASSGTNSTFVLILRGAFTPTLPASVKWSGGSVPTYTTPSVYVFTTVDGGTNWLATQTGRAFA